MGMTNQLTERLAMMDMKHRKPAASGKTLSVYYGWTKINKVMKKESIMVIFMNENPGPRVNKDGYDGVTRFMNVAYKRKQTDKEAADASCSNKIYTYYEIYMNDPHIKGSLEAALKENSDADQNNVSQSERDAISKALRLMYLTSHPGYKEPTRQLELF